MKDVRKIKVILMIILNLIVVGCQSTTKQDQIPTNIPTEDNFSVMIDDIDLLINDELSGFVYFGRDTCPNCLSFNGILNDIVKNSNDLIIHKYDTDKWRDHEAFQEILDKYGVSGIPSLIYINDNGTYEVFESTKDMKSDLISFLSSK